MTPFTSSLTTAVCLSLSLSLLSLLPLTAAASRAPRLLLLLPRAAAAAPGSPARHQPRTRGDRDPGAAFPARPRTQESTPGARPAPRAAPICAISSSSSLPVPVPASPAPGHLLPPLPWPGCGTRAPLPLPPPAPRCRRRNPPGGEVLLDAQQPLPQRLQHLPGLSRLRRPAKAGGARLSSRLRCHLPSARPVPSAPPGSLSSSELGAGGVCWGQPRLSVCVPRCASVELRLKRGRCQGFDLEQRVNPWRCGFLEVILKTTGKPLGRLGTFTRVILTSATVA